MTEHVEDGPFAPVDGKKKKGQSTGNNSPALVSGKVTPSQPDQEQRGVVSSTADQVSSQKMGGPVTSQAVHAHGEIPTRAPETESAREFRAKLAGIEETKKRLEALLSAHSEIELNELDGKPFLDSVAADLHTAEESVASYLQTDVITQPNQERYQAACELLQGVQENFNGYIEAITSALEAAAKAKEREEPSAQSRDVSSGNKEKKSAAEAAPESSETIEQSVQELKALLDRWNELVAGLVVAQVRRRVRQSQGREQSLPSIKTIQNWIERGQEAGKWKPTKQTHFQKEVLPHFAAFIMAAEEVVKRMREAANAAREKQQAQEKQQDPSISEPVEDTSQPSNLGATVTVLQTGRSIQKPEDMTLRERMDPVQLLELHRAKDAYVRELNQELIKGEISLADRLKTIDYSLKQYLQDRIPAIIQGMQHTPSDINELMTELMKELAVKP